MADPLEWRVGWDQLTPKSENEADGFEWVRLYERHPKENEARAAAETMRRLAADMPKVFRAVALEVRAIMPWTEVAP